MAGREGFVDALLAAPAGVTLLGMLEAQVRGDVPWWQVPADSDPDAVAAAVDAVTARPIGSLLAAAVDAAAFRVGPWMPGAPAELAKAYRCAEARVRVAEAIDDHFGDELHRGFDPDGQEWWSSHERGDERRARPGFRSLDRVYGAGQFTEDGLWTVSRPPPSVHADLVGAWELETGPVSRWRLPVDPVARIVEIHRPQDWAALVHAYPEPARPAEGWELPGRNQRPNDLAELLSLPTQRAARISMRRHVVPDWVRLGADHDGVHLSWAGFLTSEGFVSDLGGADVAMLRYWFSERTHWLTDAFGEPEPLAAPTFDLDPDSISFIGADPRTDTDRRRCDHAILMTRLGRSSSVPRRHDPGER